MSEELSFSEKMLENIQCGSIIKIKHKNFQGKIVDHYSIVCNETLANDEHIVFGPITTCRNSFLVDGIRNKYGNNTVVYIPQNVFSKLDRLSFVNCNAPVFKTITQLCSEIDSGEAYFYNQVVAEHFSISIGDGMLSSRKLLDEWRRTYIKTHCKVSQ